VRASPGVNDDVHELCRFGIALAPTAIKTDGEGIIPASFEQALQQKYTRKPRVLYTIPTGQNPAGSTLSVARKKQIYELACKHDILIMEDDPYCFLNYGLAPAPPLGSEAKFQVPHNPSFFSMDTQGRVLRFDSLSKTLSSGLRIGWVTGPSALIRQLELHQQATALHNSGLSQALTAKFLAHLGPAGVDAHFRDVALFYARRRDALLTAATKHLTGLARWTTPSAGMFIWFRCFDTLFFFSNTYIVTKELSTHK
jgi:DNA-binding transcriptional MocR family regulator